MKNAVNHGVGFGVRITFRFLVKFPLRVVPGVLALLLIIPILACAEEVNPEASVVSEPGSEPAESPATEEESAQEPGEQPKKRRLLSRIGPQNLTPEQLEEAERLRRLAAKYGTDPTAIVGRVQLTSQYLDLKQGGSLTDAVARVDLPFRRNVLLRLDLPFQRWSDPDRPGTTTLRGMSDIAVTAGWRAYNTPEYAVLVGVISTMPTADEPALGFGKYTVGPTIATARFLPRWESLLIGLFTQQLSVGGDPSRRAVNSSRVVGQVNSIWAERWWSIVQATWLVDWERNAKSSMTVELEVGRNVVGRWGVFARPGAGVWGRDLPGAYVWNIEGGIRYIFPSF